VIDNGVAVKAYMIELIRALPELAGFQVTWSHPTSDPHRRWVMVGRVTWDSTEWRTTRQVEETFNLEVLVSLVRPGRTSEETETEAATAGRAIEAAVMADPSLGGLVIASSWSPDWIGSAPIPEGMEGQYAARLRVRARRTR